MCDKMGVMYLGKMVETADTDDLFDNPTHPYTQALIGAALPYHPDSDKEENIFQGEGPSPINPPSCCSYERLCPDPENSEQIIEYKEVGPNHSVAIAGGCYEQYGCHYFPRVRQ